MSYFQLTYNNLAGYQSSHIHDVVTGSATINDWWHYLPDAYILQTESSLLYQSNRIREAFPRLNFLLVKIDIREFNGYLKKEAWEWFKKKNLIKLKYTGSSSLRLPPITQVRSQPKQLRSVQDILDLANKYK